MAAQTTDFLKDYQAFAQQSWEAWMQQLQSSPQATASPFQAPPASSAEAGSAEAVARSLESLEGYLAWLQRTLAQGSEQGPDDWRQQVQQLFGAPSLEAVGNAFEQAFTAAGFGGQDFGKPWLAWLGNVQAAGLGDAGPAPERTPAFGYTREQQEQWQELAAALHDYAETCKRYQALLLRAQADGVERLQKKIEAEAAEGRQVDSLKALYDLWVESAEGAYAEVARTDEFRTAYGAMVDAQMRVRALQQRQTEQWSRELGMPTRSEVSTLGQRVQELRREIRILQGENRRQAIELEALRAELAAARQGGAAAKRGASAAGKARSAAVPAAARQAAAPAKTAAKAAPGKAPSRAPGRSAPRK